ncbi:MAG: hypothetical protein N2748_00130 [candidate division WOR-3 bacterium]|nr:hypothetical protein [candidate division WOR-3 bacterium]
MSHCLTGKDFLFGFVISPESFKENALFSGLHPCPYPQPDTELGSEPITESDALLGAWWVAEYLSWDNVEIH